MSKDSKYIIRRTLSQERFEVLWKKRHNGQATLRDLTEMDEIINRDEGVRRFVLEEMQNPDAPVDNDNMQDLLANAHAPHHGFVAKLKAFLNRIFHMAVMPAKLASTTN